MSILSASWLLNMKALVWRWLMKIGMSLHHHANPRPPSPSFIVKIPSRISSKRGHFKLVFYVPEEYKTAPEEQRFPVVVNFHGGGFTLGTGTDDARWAKSVLDSTKAVFVSVAYRLAPKYGFSVGVEDSADAVIYLAAHADELRLDPNRIALSGFSAGGNFALTVPLMLHDLRTDAGRRTLDTNRRPGPPSRGPSQQSQASSLNDDPSASEASLPIKQLEPTELEIEHKMPDFTIRGIVSFYPPTDFRISREDKRKTNPAPQFNLPPVLTNLFDESYLSSENASKPLDLSDPYLSPAAASDALLRDAYPDSITLYTCEYDMLNAEGTGFAERLRTEGIGKVVKGGLIKEVPHAFDKKPNPMKFSKAAERCYGEACAELNVVFGRTESVENLTQLELSENVERFEDDDRIDPTESNGAASRKPV
jgi:acetyl esterase/lipase